jgi:protein ImuA
MPEASKAEVIAELRARIADFETAGPRMDVPGEGSRAVTFGASSIDGVLPGGGLRHDALHEIAAVDYRDMGAALGFAAALAARCAEAAPDAPVLWCEGGHTPFDVGALYGPGLMAFGLDPARLIIVSPPRDIDLLWTMEEALRLGALAAVVGEIDGRAARLDLTSTRRLQLAAEEHTTPAFLLTGHESAGATAAVTRWRVGSAPSSPTVEIAGLAGLIGRPRWHVRLERCRGARLAADMGGARDGEWIVEWDARTKMLHDASDADAADMLRPSQHAFRRPSRALAG